ncbi:MAG: radical SAM protein [Arcobacteraceae bacterium]|nr:radical SAM protein [Arcobacteraceae bacterium]
MFRASNLLKTIINDTPSRVLDGSIVIWNFTNRCNLSCLHCYSKADIDSNDTLDIEIIKSTIDEFIENKIKFIIFSGGEPLVRKDIFEIAQYAKDKGIITYLSTNGLYINHSNAQRIVDTFDYIGISIDGDEITHDYFRGLKGSYRKSIDAMKLVQSKGGKVGIRFTITKTTIDSLEHIFALSEKENFSKIYISHFVYSGRGLENLEMDLSKEERMKSVEYILNKTFEYQENGKDIEIVTGNMECDAIMFLKMVKKRYPHLVSKLVSRLSAWGGNSAGRKLVNIDSFGYVKPDPFFPFRLGNIQEQSFSDIWNDKKSLLLDRLRSERQISGKCTDCKYMFICNGGSRSRAFAVSGDLWGEDPSCYLSEKEIA